MSPVPHHYTILLDRIYWPVVFVHVHVLDTILAPRCQTKDLIFVAHMIKYQPFGTLLVVHSVSFGEFYYCSTFASMTKKARQMKEVRYPLTLHYHDLTNFLVICEFQTIVKFVKTVVRGCFSHSRSIYYLLLYSRSRNEIVQRKYFKIIIYIYFNKVLVIV